MGREGTFVAINVGAPRIAARNTTTAARELDAAFDVPADRTNVRLRGSWGWAAGWRPAWKSPGVLVVDFRGRDGEVQGDG